MGKIKTGKKVYYGKTKSLNKRNSRFFGKTIQEDNSSYSAEEISEKNLLLARLDSPTCSFLSDNIKTGYKENPRKDIYKEDVYKEGDSFFSTRESTPPGCSYSPVQTETGRPDNMEYEKNGHFKFENEQHFQDSFTTSGIFRGSDTPYIPEGRRLVDINTLFAQIQALAKHPPFDCTLADMVILKENRNGLKSSFLLKCKMCKLEEHFNLFDESVESMDMNIVATFAAVSTGIGFSTNEEYMSILNIPFMSPNTYQKCHEKLGDKIRQTAWTTMEKAAEEESALARELGEVDKENRPCITVVTDGAWSKRSYNVNYDAASGVACIIGQRTGKLLFLGIRNKYCSLCARAKEKNIDPIPDHVCYKNWSATSTSMESDIIVEGFKKSIEMYGIVYKRLVGDGDSSVYKKITEARPYGSTLVEKIECKNHLLRNFCSKLREICGKKKSNSTNSPVLPQLRRQLQNNIRRLRTAVTMATTYRNNENTNFPEKVKCLIRDLKNVPSHVFGEHRECKEIGYFKCEKKDGEENLIPQMKACGLLQDIEVVFNRLIYHASSLLRNLDTNMAEHYNSVVCKFVGGKRINYTKRGSYQIRCEAAALSFNVGSGEYHREMVKSIVGKSPSGFTRRYIETVKKRRLYLGKLKQRNLFKKKTKSIAPPDKDYGLVSEEQDAVQADMDAEDYEVKKSVFLRDLEKSEEEISEIELNTRGQGGNPLWSQERSLRLTASNFGSICKMLPKTNCKNKVKQLLYSDFRGNEHTRYGHDKEPFAIKELEAEFNVKVQNCGLFIDKNCSALAASPDGLVGSLGLVEVKCPSKASNLTPTEAIKNKVIKFATLDENGKMTLKLKHEYYYQIQGQLHITQRDYCYFIVWTPKGMLVEKIWRDDEFWKKNMEEKLKVFYFKCLLPEIIDPRHTRKMEIRNPPRNL